MKVIHVLCGFPFALFTTLFAAETNSPAAKSPDRAGNSEPAPHGIPGAAKRFGFDNILVAPLRVHLFTAQDEPALCTTLEDADIARIVGKVNRVWSQAGICFYVESIIREKPAAVETPGEDLPGNHRWLLSRIPDPSYSRDAFNIYYIHQFGANGVFLGKAIFVKDTAALRPVEGGIDEPLPRVTSHELGHALGLPHRQDRLNLMASGTTGTSLNDDEIARSRADAMKMKWFARAPDLLAQADALFHEGKAAEARAIYARLAAIPPDDDPIPRIRARAAK